MHLASIKIYQRIEAIFYEQMKRHIMRGLGLVEGKQIKTS
jgi:hypothetical protein